MSDWKIGLAEAPARTDLLIMDFLTARWAWKRLTKPAQAAVAAAYPDGWVSAHPQTLRALDRHGFIVNYATTDYHLTEAATACAKWNVTGADRCSNCGHLLAKHGAKGRCCFGACPCAAPVRQP